MPFLARPILSLLLMPCKEATVENTLNQFSIDEDIVWANVVCNACHFDDALSWKAVGLLWYLLSHPDKWRFYRADLIRRHSDGERAVKSGLKELREGGYLRTVKRQGKDGTFDGYEWYISPVPVTEEQWQSRLDPAGRFDTAGEESTGGTVPGECKTAPHSGNNKVSCLQGETENGSLFPSEEEKTDFVVEVGSFCERLEVPWKLKRTLAEWCREIEREPSYAGVDFALETRKAAEYWESNGSRKPKSPDRSLRNWFSNAAKFAREERSRRVEEKKEEVGLPGWAADLEIPE